MFSFVLKYFSSQHIYYVQASLHYYLKIMLLLKNTFFVFEGFTKAVLSNWLGL
jgi:hypothetical protein